MLRLRVEFLTMGAGRGRLGGQVDVGEAKLLGAAAIDVGATLSGAIAVPDTAGQVFADLSVTGGSVYVAVGTNPDPGSEPRCLLTPGRSRCLHVQGGQSIVATAAGDVSQAEAVGGAVTAASPMLAAGDRSPLSLNGRGALRVVAQAPDGTDLDPTVPTQTTAARSGTITIAQVSIANTAPALPALAANTTRKNARISYKTGGANVYWSPTAAGATAAAGLFVPPGTSFEIPGGYTGDVYLVADAAGPTAVSIAQLQ